MKIEIKWYTYVYILIYGFSIYFKSLALIFCVLALHELGHILMALCLKLPIQKIIIYPFGIGMRLNNLDYMPSYNEFLLAMGGPLMFFVIGGFLGFLNNFNIISDVNYMWISGVNKNILLFNLLPIFPLDGGRMLKALIHCLTTYKRGIIISYTLSIIAICCGLQLNVDFYFCYFIILMLCTIYQIYHINSSVYNFYLYRYTNNLRLPPFFHYKKDLYRNKNNMISSKNKLYDEKHFILNYLNKTSNNNMNDSDFMI